MNNIQTLVDFEQLLKWEFFDVSTKALLEKCLLANKRVLIVATNNSGKNTIQNAVVNFYYRNHESPLVIPPLENVPFKTFKTNAAIKKMLSTVKGYKSYVASFDYKNPTDEDLTPLYSHFQKHFDCILEIHNNGKRKLWRVVVNGQTKFEQPETYKHEAA